MVEKAYQYGHLLSIENIRYKTKIKDYFLSLVKDDILSGDVTSLATINPEQWARAVVQTEQSGIIAGIDEVCLLYNLNGVTSSRYANDGAYASAGAKLIEFAGNARTILSLERVNLNILRRMSGIATLTKKYCDALSQSQPNYKTRVAATRKTSIEKRLEKRAVYLGGGLTHRMDLSGSIIIKDCHLAVIQAEGSKSPITTALERAYANSKYCPVEIEVKNSEEALEAASTFNKLNTDGRIAIIMFDNMHPREIGKYIG